MRAAFAIILCSASIAHADGGRLLSDDTFTVGEHGQYVLDGTMLVASPSVLPAGMSAGVAAGITRECGCSWSYGARASWSTATDSSETWIVTDQELRLRATLAIHHRAGRGTIGLHVSGSWLAIVSAGPQLVTDTSGTPHGGFTAQLGVAWQP